MSHALSCKDFGFTLMGVRILQNISFELEKGSYLSIVGPNGTGKSTLLKNLLRLYDSGRTEGEVLIQGRSLHTIGQKELASMVGYVPQAGGRIPPFTVREFLKLSRYPYGFRQDALRSGEGEWMTEALELTGTTHLADKSMDAISGGERQRAFLAAALAQGTDILLLDEPASFLDPRHVSDLNNLLKMLNRERGLTIITVTHDLNHPLDAGGQVLVLRPREQVFFGPAERLINADRSPDGILERAFNHTFTYLTHPITGQALVVAD